MCVCLVVSTYQTSLLFLLCLWRWNVGKQSNSKHWYCLQYSKLLDENLFQSCFSTNIVVNHLRRMTTKQIVEISIIKSFSNQLSISSNLIIYRIFPESSVHVLCYSGCTVWSDLNSYKNIISISLLSMLKKQQFLTQRKHCEINVRIYMQIYMCGIRIFRITRGTTST